AADLPGQVDRQSVIDRDQPLFARYQANIVSEIEVVEMESWMAIGEFEFCTRRSHGKAAPDHQAGKELLVLPRDNAVAHKRYGAPRNDLGLHPELVMVPQMLHQHPGGRADSDLESCAIGYEFACHGGANRADDLALLLARRWRSGKFRGVGTAL